MQRREVILKAYVRLDNFEISYDEYINKIVWDYGRKLEEQGWKAIPIEGGCLSPDESTLFIYNRSPYNGQLIQWTEKDEKAYRKNCREFMASGEFIDLYDFFKQQAYQKARSEWIKKGYEDLDREMFETAYEIKFPVEQWD